MGLTELNYKIDQFIVDRANEAVKAWNWTTGKTRADLANLLHFSGSAIAGVSFLPMAPIWLGMSCVMTYFNNRIDKIDDSLEDSKYDTSEYLRSGHFAMATGTMPALSSFSPEFSLEEKIYLGLIGGGLISHGASYYVMRADYQKPRKNCVRRGIDKLSKILDESAKPEPQTIPIRFRNLNLESTV